MNTRIAASDPPFRPRRLGHVNLYVSDLDRSMDYFNAVVGLEEVYRRPPIKGGFLSNGNTHHDIGMVETSSPLCHSGEAGLNHLAFEVEHEADLVAGYRRLPDPAAAFPRTIDHDITRSIYGLDPDGNAVEIYADMHKDWRTRRTGEVTKETPKWVPGDGAPTADRNYHPTPEIRRVDGAAFHPERITHAAMVAADYEAEFDYYTGIMGLSPRLGGRGTAFCALSGTTGDIDLTLFRAAETGAEPGLHHIGFLVTEEDDLDASLAAYRARHGEPDAVVESGFRRSVFLRDPDGIRIQFYAEHGDPVAGLAALAPQMALFAG
ncbi:MAG: dioxygenase [Rhodospirillaceae bacterium]|jgi:catechol 2,3-dioxygenase|nr:dioxygenase [Rhodospirillaceae bacterium]